MPHAIHNGCRLYWERDGQPEHPALLLLRGLGRSSRHWGELRELLARSFYLLLTDNRGVGRSDAPWPPYSTPMMADDHVAILDAAGVARTHVFGISLGGMIAQQLAIRHPARVDRVILGCTTPGGRHGERRPGTIKALLRASLTGERGMRSIAPLLLSAETLRAHPELVDQSIAIARSEPRQRRGMVGQLLAARNHNAWHQLPQIVAPTLVVTGTADLLIPPGNSTKIAERIPGARLHLIEGAGHDFPADRPDETATVIAEFLRA